MLVTQFFYGVLLALDRCIINRDSGDRFLISSNIAANSLWQKYSNRHLGY